MVIKYSIGDIIRYERKEQGLSQEELSDGICTPSWLSKIESGSCIPTYSIFSLLMQRLGKDATPYICFQSEIEMRIEKLKFEVRRFYSNEQMDKAILSYRELEKLIKDKEPFNEQFMAFVDILLFKDQHEDKEKVISRLYEILHMTRTEFDIKKLKQYLLSKDEIMVINNIAIALRELNRMDEAIEIMEALKSYLDNPKFDFEEKRRTYPVILYNLAKWNRLNGDYIKTIAVCDEAQVFSRLYDTWMVVPELIFNKGCAYALLESKTKAREAFIQSYHLFSAKGEVDNASHLKAYVLENFQIDLTPFIG